jgi:hypothetical protein
MMARALLPMTEQTVAEDPCHGTDAEQACSGAQPWAAANGDLWADQRRGWCGLRLLDAVLPRGGRPGGEEQHELGHREDEDQQTQDRAKRRACGL